MTVVRESVNGIRFAESGSGGRAGEADSHRTPAAAMRMATRLAAEGQATRFLLSASVWSTRWKQCRSYPGLRFVGRSRIPRPTTTTGRWLLSV